MKNKRIFQLKAHEYKFADENIPKLNEQIVSICDYLCEKGFLDPDDDVKIFYGYQGDDIINAQRTVSIHQFVQINLY